MYRIEGQKLLASTGMRGDVVVTDDIQGKQLGFICSVDDGVILKHGLFESLGEYARTLIGAFGTQIDSATNKTMKDVVTAQRDALRIVRFPITTETTDQLNYAIARTGSGARLISNLRQMPGFTIKALNQTKATFFNNCTNNAEPDWSRFKSLYIGGCRPDPDDEGHTLGCQTNEDATFWTAYGVLASGPDADLSEAITDVVDLTRAVYVGAHLANLSGLDCGFRALGEFEGRQFEIKPTDTALMTPGGAQNWINDKRASSEARLDRIIGELDFLRPKSLTQARVKHLIATTPFMGSASLTADESHFVRTVMMDKNTAGSVAMNSILHRLALDTPRPRYGMSPAQVDLARHALGLDQTDRKMSCRNRYFAVLGGEQHALWDDLVSKGLAVRSDEVLTNYHLFPHLFQLTETGARLALREGERLDPEDFGDLKIEASELSEPKNELSAPGPDF